MKKLKFILLALTLFFVSSVNAQKIPFQGKLLEDGIPFTGSKDFTFSIDVNGVIWTEDHLGVPVSDGLYAVTLGSITPLPHNLFGGVDSHSLNISISGTAISPIELFAPVVKRDIIKDITGLPDAVGSSFELSGVKDASNTSFYQVALSGKGSTSDGHNVGVYGISEESSDKWQIGVHGVSGGDGTGFRYAIRGEVFGTNSLRSNAVIGYNQIVPPDNAMVVGVYGRTFKGAPGSLNYGVRAWAHGTAGRNVGIFAEAQNSVDENWAGWFEGDVLINGNLTTVNSPGSGGMILGDKFDNGITINDGAPKISMYTGGSGADDGNLTIELNADDGSAFFDGDVTINGTLNYPGGLGSFNNIVLEDVVDGSQQFGSLVLLGNGGDQNIYMGAKSFEDPIVGAQRPYMSMQGSINDENLVWMEVYQRAVGIEAGALNFRSTDGNEFGIDAYGFTGELNNLGVNNSVNVKLNGQDRASLISNWGTFGQGAMILKDADGNDRGYFTVNDYEDNGTVYHGYIELSNNRNSAGARIDGNGIISVRQGSNLSNTAVEMFESGDAGYMNVNNSANENSIALDGESGNIRASSITLDDGNGNSIDIDATGISGQMDVLSLKRATLQSNWGGDGQGALELRDATDITRATYSVDDDGAGTYWGNIRLSSSDGSEFGINAYGFTHDISDFRAKNIIAVSETTNQANNVIEMFESGDVGYMNINDASNQNVISLIGDDGSGYFAGEVVASRFNARGSDGMDRVQIFDDGSGNISLRSNANVLNISLDGGNGNITAISVTETSDRRLKKNIQPLKNTLKNVIKMNGVFYQWKDEVRGKEKQIGLIAQEVEVVYPEFVHTDLGGMKSVNYSKMVTVLIEAIKELNNKIENLEIKNTELKAQVFTYADLQNQVDQLQTMVQGLIQQDEISNEFQVTGQDK